MRLASIGTNFELLKYPLNEGGAFLFSKGKRTDSYKLDKSSPEDIYKHNFISPISLALHLGKRVVIECGEYTDERKTIEQFHPLKLPNNPSQIDFIISELIYGEPARKIYHMDDKHSDKKREIEPSISYTIPRNGVFGFLKHLIGLEPPPSLFIELKEKVNKIIGGTQAYDYLEGISNYSDY